MNSWKSSLFGRVSPAVEDVEVGDREPRRNARGVQGTPQRHSGGGGHRPGGSHRHPDGGVGSETSLVLGAVELDQGVVQLRDIGKRPSTDRLGDLTVDVADSSENALASVAGRVAVPELDRLPRAGRCAGRYACARNGAIAERHRHRQGRVASGVENLHGFDA